MQATPISRSRLLLRAKPDPEYRLDPLRQRRDDVSHLGNPGGINAAGETIAGGGIDSLLSLYDSNVVLITSNDDGGGGLNSLIAGSYGPGSFILRLAKSVQPGRWSLGRRHHHGHRSVSNSGSTDGGYLSVDHAGRQWRGILPTEHTDTDHAEQRIDSSPGRPALWESSTLTAPTINLEAGAVINLAGGALRFDTFSQTGGQLDSSGTISVADANGSNGQYNMSDGSLRRRHALCWQRRVCRIRSDWRDHNHVNHQAGGRDYRQWHLLYERPIDPEHRPACRWSQRQGAMVQSSGDRQRTALMLAVNASGSYALNGGNLTANTEWIGFGGQATFTQKRRHKFCRNPGHSQPCLSSQLHLQPAKRARSTRTLLAVNYLGTFNQSGGTLKATTFNQAGGTILGILQNQGTFNYLSGTFSGRLLNQGVVNLNADFLAGDGLDNQASFDMGREVGDAQWLWVE